MATTLGPRRRAVKLGSYLALIVAASLLAVTFVIHMTLLRDDWQFIQEAVDTPTFFKKEEPPNRRKFVKYTPSKWEQLWTDNVDAWAKEKSICRRLVEDQSNYVHDFLNMTCTSRLPPPYSSWCAIDDDWHPLWYDSDNRSSFLSLNFNRPAHIAHDVVLPPPQPVIPTADQDHIFSKFTFLDETTGELYHEYIEPLVSHLRHPLSKCIEPPLPLKMGSRPMGFTLSLSRGYVLPPPPPTTMTKRYRESFYFDAGASIWQRGLGGPSLKFFTNVWQRYGIKFDHVLAFEGKAEPEQFYRNVPVQWKPKSSYQQVWISSNPNNDTNTTPFLPSLIRRTARKEDYVLFKLDIDSPDVEMGTIEHLLNAKTNDDIQYIDELVWEHHATGNYLMEPNWYPNGLEKYNLPFVTLGDSYQYFLRLRHRGVRAHSWV